MTKLIKIDNRELLKNLDKKWLFNGLWKFKGNNTEGERVLAGLVDKIDSLKINACAVYKICETLLFNFAGDELRKLTGQNSIQEKGWLTAVTIGDDVVEIARDYKNKDKFADYFYITGFAAALAEAGTEAVHRRICEEEKLDYNCTVRISPGYPVWPDLREQKQIENILDFHKIGLSVSETFQLQPEYSTTSLILKI